MIECPLISLDILVVGTGKPSAYSMPANDLDVHRVVDLRLMRLRPQKFNFLFVISFYLQSVPVK
jgi:hypothetical protein